MDGLPCVFITCGTKWGGKGGGDLNRVVGCGKQGSGVQQVDEGGWQNATCAAVVGDSIFFVCGSIAGCSGGGGLWRRSVHADTGASEAISAGWGNASCMAGAGGSIFVTCACVGGGSGAGGLYKINPETGDYRAIGQGGWTNATVMAGLGDVLFIVCGRIGGCTGGGGLWRVDTETGVTTVVSGDGWGNATTMTSCGGHLFITCGKLGGGGGGGGLYKINPETGEYQRIGPQNRWMNATTMCSIGGQIFLTSGALDGLDGHGGLYCIDPETGSDFLIGKSWENATTMAGAMVHCGAGWACGAPADAAGSIFNAQVASMGIGGGGDDGGGGRQAPISEPSIQPLPTTRWQDIVPPCGCADFLRGSAAVRAACPRATIIADDCAAKAEELRWEDGLPAALDENQIVALAAYSHDSGAGQAGNLYFELNKALRKRDKEDRAALIDGWGGYMHYMMGAMAKLPRVEGVCYRGYPDKATAIAQYKAGRPIQWGAFASTSTDFGAAKSFTNQVTGIIFKITVTDGRDINAYSFFPAENEVLLSPDHHFHVSSAPYERDGFTIIDMVQDAGNTFVS